MEVILLSMEVPFIMVAPPYPRSQAWCGDSFCALAMEIKEKIEQNPLIPTLIAHPLHTPQLIRSSDPASKLSPSHSQRFFRHLVSHRLSSLPLSIDFRLFRIPRQLKFSYSASCVSSTSISAFLWSRPRKEAPHEVQPRGSESAAQRRVPLSPRIFWPHSRHVLESGLVLQQKSLCSTIAHCSEC